MTLNDDDDDNNNISGFIHHVSRIVNLNKGCVNNDDDDDDTSIGILGPDNIYFANYFQSKYANESTKQMR